MKKSSLKLIYHLILLFGICAATENNGTQVFFAQRFGHLSCSCSETHTYNYLDSNLTEHILNHLETSKGNIFSMDDYPELKKRVGKKCLKCEVNQYDCKNNFEDGNVSCLKKSVSFNLMGDSVPGSIPHQRFARETSDCAYPAFLQTASISCTKYGSFITCKQSCAYGHTLANGIEQELACKYKENKWKPTGFKECEHCQKVISFIENTSTFGDNFSFTKVIIPFVDCTLSLTSGGSANCTSPVLTAGPECNVQCSAHEDKEAVQEYRTACNIDGVWDPPLPFCMSAGTGIVLAKAPETRLHMT